MISIFPDTQHKRIVTLSSAAIVFGLSAIWSTYKVLSSVGIYQAVVQFRPEVYQIAISIIIVGMVLHILFRSFFDQSREEYEKSHNLLTGLPNREGYLDILNNRASADRLLGTIILINPEKLRAINASKGEGAGDAVFAEYAERLNYLFTEPNLVAVSHSGTFAIWVQGIRNYKSIAEITKQICKAFALPVKHEDRLIYGNITCGAVLTSDRNGDPGELLARAELALLEAKSKRDGKPVIFNSGLRDSIAKRSDLESELREVLDKDQLIPFFQPLFGDDGRTLVGVEALARWPHREKGWIAPTEFVPMAASLNLTSELGRLMMKKACSQIHALGELKVSVNVTPDHLLEEDFVSQVRTILEETGLPPHRLELEIVETALIEETDQTIEQINSLRALGISVALDDFGTGYSGLSYLNRIAVDRIKVDASFVREVDQSESARSMVETIISMAQERGLEVTVEGVETEDQLNFLKQFDNLTYQGYLFGPPMPVADLVNNNLLLSQSSKAFEMDTVDERAAARRALRGSPFEKIN